MSWAIRAGRDVGGELLKVGDRSLAELAEIADKRLHRLLEGGRGGPRETADRVDRGVDRVADRLGGVGRDARDVVPHAGNTAADRVAEEVPDAAEQARVDRDAIGRGRAPALKDGDLGRVLVGLLSERTQLPVRALLERL